MWEYQITVILAIGGYFLMPASPGTCQFLNERERYIAAERIQREHKEVNIILTISYKSVALVNNLQTLAEKTQLKHVKRAVFNINNLFCAFGFALINVTVQSFSLFLVSHPPGVSTRKEKKIFRKLTKNSQRS